MELPPGKGVYALVLELNDLTQISLKKWATCVFEPGQYIYLGSALGSGGLRARLQHHLRLSIFAHWHIDSFRRVARLSAVVYAITDERLECVWCRLIQNDARSFVPVAGFGASDCRHNCGAHLIGLSPSMEPEDLCRVLVSSRAGLRVVYQPISDTEN